MPYTGSSALETYEPDDKSFAKRVTRPGTGDVKPNDGSVCVLNMMQIGETIYRLNYMLINYYSCQFLKYQ